MAEQELLLREEPRQQQHAVMGIDPSLTAFAVAVAAPGKIPALQVYRSKPAGDVRARVMRYRSLVWPLLGLAIEHKPKLVLIEGYAFGAAVRRGEDGKVKVSQRGHHDRSELGGILRDRLLEHVGSIVEVAPAALKKFMAGSGAAKKSEAVSAFSVRVGKVFKSDDEADSWALMMLGMCLLGQSAPETKQQREVVVGLRALVEAA